MPVVLEGEGLSVLVAVQRKAWPEKVVLCNSMNSSGTVEEHLLLVTLLV